jgi:hypothetical protein
MSRVSMDARVACTLRRLGVCPAGRETGAALIDSSVRREQFVMQTSVPERWVCPVSIAANAPPALQLTNPNACLVSFVDGFANAGISVRQSALADGCCPA